MYIDLCKQLSRDISDLLLLFKEKENAFDKQVYNCLSHLQQVSSDKELSRLIDENSALIESALIRTEEESKLKLVKLIKLNSDFKYALQEKSNNQKFADVNIGTDMRKLIPHVVKKYLPNYTHRLSRDEGVIFEVDMKRTGTEQYDELIDKFLEVVLHNFIVDFIKKNPIFIFLSFEEQEEIVDSYMPSLRQDTKMIVDKELSKKVTDRYNYFFGLSKAKEIKSFFKANGITMAEISSMVENHSKMGFLYKKEEIQQEYKDFVESFNNDRKIKKKQLVSNFFKTRKHLICHFFYNDNEWHCFYWSPQDLLGHGQFWDKPHMHYNSSFISNITKEEFENRLRKFEYSNTIHIELEK